MNGIKPTTPQTASPEMTPEQKNTIAMLQLKMIQLGVSAKPLPLISVGPVISIYRFLPDGNTRVNQIEALADDFSIVLGKEVMIKRFPGDTAVSVTIPNDVRTEVEWLPVATAVWQYFRPWQPRVEGAPSEKKEGHIPIPMGFGVDHLGKVFIEDLTQMPHLLVAGSTGSGKSTLIKSLIASIVYTMNSSTISLVLSDTKGVEFNLFSGLPHLRWPIATSAFATLEQMDFLIEETERRLKLFPPCHATNIHEYNAAVGEQQRLELIAMFIDECADIMDLGKVADQKLGKIVQKSRAAGIHIVACTQRPSAKMIDGTIKSNFPARLSFRLPSQIDSRVALTHTGAEHLMMKGDMLYLSPNRPGLHRLHSPRASMADIKGAIEAAMMKE